MNIDARNPFDAFKGSEWEMIKEFADPEKFRKLNIVFRYFAGQITREELPEPLREAETHVIENYYNSRFTTLFGEVLTAIGKRFITANPAIQFDFSHLAASSTDNHDPDIWYCAECGSTDVEFKQWTLPNSANEIVGGDYDRDDCWCNDCEEHHHINSCLQSEYPAILKQIQEQENQED